jgi:hypothetical protein
MRCTCAILSSVPGPALQYFSTLSHKRHDFRKTLLNAKCVFWFPLRLSSGTFLILRNIERDVMKNVWWSSCKVPFVFSNFNGTWIFWTVFRKIPKQNFMKIRPVAAELLHADRRTDITKLIVGFAILRSRLKCCTAGQLTDDSMVHTHIYLTPWSRVPLEKLTGLQLVKKFPAFCGTQKFFGFPVSKSECWDGYQDSKLPLHASHVALPT